jgi:hypothetical protein
MHIVSHEGVEYPFIEVASGIRTPVAVKKAIEGKSGDVLLTKDAFTFVGSPPTTPPARRSRARTIGSAS